MSLLPQRKKSAEEIAKLRESLGVPAPPEEPTAPDTIVPASHEAVVEHHPIETVPDTIVPSPHEAIVERHPAPAPSEPEPAAKQGPKPVHSLKRSERIPPSGPQEREAIHIDVPHLPKPVRSLRKSEQIPVLTPIPEKSSDDSKLPVHRKSDEEIAELRRREALALMEPHPPNPKLAAAHIAILIPGYLCAIAGAACFLFYEFPIAATAACAAVALLISGFVFLRRPISRHHAGFIAMIALFVLVFGALHYFPHLQHAT